MNPYHLPLERLEVLLRESLPAENGLAWLLSILRSRVSGKWRCSHETGFDELFSGRVFNRGAV